VVFWKVVDVLVTKLTLDPLTNVVGLFVAWCIATLIGWYGGRIAVRIIEQSSIRLPQLSEIKAELIILILMMMGAVFVFELSTWASSLDFNAALSTLLGLDVNYYWIFIIANWLTTIFLMLYWGTLYAAPMFWSGEDQMSSYYAHEEQRKEIDKLNNDLEKSLTPDFLEFTKFINRIDKEELKNILDVEPPKPKTFGEYVSSQWHGSAVQILYFWLFITLIITSTWFGITGNWLIPTIAWIIYLSVLGILIFLFSLSDFG
jgi:hypothetical protein